MTTTTHQAPHTRRPPNLATAALARARRRLLSVWGMPMFLVALVCVLGGTGALATAQPGPGQPGLGDGSAGRCPSVAGIFVSGTGETNSAADPSVPVGLLAPIARGLTGRFGSRFRAVFPAYAARAMDGMAYGDSESQGRNAVEQAIGDIAARCRATKFVIAGYSQGADVAGDVAAKIGCEQFPVSPQQVLAVGLVADPRQGTSGGKLVGPAVQGTGIRGPRPTGFCQLSAVTAQFCETGDRYCATDAAANPLLAGLGRILSQPTGTTPAPGANSAGGPSQNLTESLNSGFTSDEMQQLPNRIATIVGQLGSGHPDPVTLRDAVDAVGQVLPRLGDLRHWVDANPAAAQHLSTAQPGTPDRAADQVLSALRGTNLDAASDAATTLADRLTEAGPNDAASAPYPELTSAADALAGATTALTSTPSDTW
ncbi:cutinase family protein [Nocardia blacklockiae]|uniref:cutinase family protein n=1 Tax=Nocardia blacklockiae TaxID=480036 RepID=UPI002B4AB960|nr:cutinase family protein [Nocardia blacklockiae]MBF6171138.1 cutinase family protein [Nocardia blacklockiae]